MTTDTERSDIVGCVRGECVSPSTNCLNRENWKLGDIFRSAPVTVGTPSAYFKDSRDGVNAFATHRTNNVRNNQTISLNWPNGELINTKRLNAHPDVPR